MEHSAPAQHTIRFSGRSFMAFVLQPQPPAAEWLAEFDDFAKRSPGFFVGRPVVVDISLMPRSRPDLVHIVTELRVRHITIIGLDGVPPGELGADARGLPPLLSGGRTLPDPVGMPAPAATAEPGEHAVAPPAHAPAPVSGPSRIIESVVRSGQSVVCMDGDVTIIGTVASGAEVVASGSIHIYGALRGRAIAGAAGDSTARIFCRDMQAELIAINGLYKTAEDIGKAVRGRPVQACLDGDALHITPFN